ncbi:PAN domain-containing protein [Photobacterium damselae]|uniref:PAN domain-containing protein n=1 Tax=Photobacterium damselae TaxID=38293 RepID=UPI0030F3EAE7
MFNKKIIAASVLSCMSIALYANAASDAESEMTILSIENTQNKSNKSVRNIIIDGESCLGLSFKLPQHNFDKEQIKVTSNCENMLLIDSFNTVTDSTMYIEKDESYVFEYDSNGRYGYKKWLITSSPVQQLNIKDIKSSIIPLQKKPEMHLEINEGDNLSSLHLPANARQGDMIVIKNNQDDVVTIKKTGVNTKSDLNINKGDVFKFVYNQNDDNWYILSEPELKLSLSDVKGSAIQTHYAKTIITVDSDDKVKNVRLPAKANLGQRIIFDTKEHERFFVTLDVDNKEMILENEVVAFIVDDNGHWARETSSINTLLLYSHRNASHPDVLSDENAKNRLLKQFDDLNQGLENSKAAFRYRLAHIAKINTPTEWDEGGVTQGVWAHPDVKDLLIKHNAYQIYYNGIDDSIGCAYASGPRFAAATVNCMAMEHELGHNRGIAHFAEDSDWYNVGYKEERTFVGGNKIEYYSTPNVISPKSKLPLGIPNEVDAVRAMNENTANIVTDSTLEGLSFHKLANRAISGHNIKTLSKVTASECMLACIDEFWCASIDYHKNNNKCDLSDRSAKDTGTYTSDVFDHYVSPVVMFEKMENRAISGHNIKTLTNVSPAQCVIACNDESWCASIDYHKNSNKCDLSDRSAKDTGTYTSDAFDHYVSPVVMFEKMENRAISGHNIKTLTNVSPTQCVIACNDESWCASIDYHKNNNKCDLSDRSAKDTGTYTSDVFDHYVSPVVMFEKMENRAISGHNIKTLTNVSPAQCVIACNDESWCASIDYHKNSNKCDLSDRSAKDTGTYTSDAFDHYVSPVVMFEKMENRAISGHNIKTLTNVSPVQCVIACNDESWCASIDYHKNSNKCDLSDRSAKDTGTYTSDAFDHYVSPRTANQVILYTDANYQGSSITTIGSMPWIDDDFDDQLSSIKIPNGWKVTLYEDANYKGRSITLTNNDDWLNDFNDLTSSIHIQKN